MRRRRKGTAAVVLMTINTPKKNDDFAKGETHNYDILKFIFKTSSKDLFSCFRNRIGGPSNRKFSLCA